MDSTSKSSEQMAVVTLSYNCAQEHMSYPKIDEGASDCVEDASVKVLSILFPYMHGVCTMCTKTM